MAALWWQAFSDLVFVQRGTTVLTYFTLPETALFPTFRLRADPVGFANGQIQLRFGMDDGDALRSRLGVSWGLSLTQGRRYRSQQYRSTGFAAPPATSGNPLGLAILPPRAVLKFVVFFGQATVNTQLDVACIDPRETWE